MVEIKLFYDWLETHELSSSGIALWHGLMFIANRSGWKSSICIPLSVIEARTGIPRASIYRERERLHRLGLIDYVSSGGKSSAVYQIHSFEKSLVSQKEGKNDSQEDSRGDSPVQVESLDSQNESQNHANFENIYKLNYTESSKGNIEDKIGVEATSPLCLSPEVKKERKSCAKKKEQSKVSQSNDSRFLKFQKWIEQNTPAVGKMREPFSESQFEQLMSHYTHDEVTRILRAMENYLPLGKKNKSAYLTAVNWLGRQSGSQSRARGQPSTGQYVGQIKQPDTEVRKEKLLERFESKKR